MVRRRRRRSGLNLTPYVQHRRAGRVTRLWHIRAGVSAIRSLRFSVPKATLIYCCHTAGSSNRRVIRGEGFIWFHF